MRFPGLKSDKLLSDKTLKVSEFQEGINDEAGRWANKDCVLQDSVNMNYTEDALKTRSGIRAVEESLTGPEEIDDTLYLPFTVTDTVYYKNSKPYNLAYCSTGYDAGTKLRIFLVDSSGNIQSAGSILFNRIDSSTYYVPKKVVFVVAGEMSGNGVFAFIECRNGQSMYCEIYEATENFASWQIASNSIYVPTVLINGRGEQYEAAASLGDFSYPEPEQLEEMNYLTTRFKCFFSSDGLSSYFRLPYGNLIGYPSLVCRLYYSADSYVQWSIPGYTTSNTQTVNGQQITLFLDRTLGLLRFCTPTDDYHVPIMPSCKLNNIMVIAGTNDNDNINAVVSSMGSVMLDNRVYFYGSGVKRNCIYCAKISNPLYFPESAKLYLGDGASAVTSLKVQNGKLIAFKPGETYRVITSFKDDIIKKAVLPTNTIYMKPDALSAQTIDNNIGCPYPETVRLCGSRLVWLARDKRVYALATTTYGNTTNIYKVSQPLGDRLGEALKTAQTVFALTDSGKYILAVDKTAFVMNFRVRGFGYSRTYYSKDDTLKSPAWFVWKFNSNTAFYGGEVIDGGAVFLSCVNTMSYYLSIIAGRDDTVIGYKNGQYNAEEFPVTSYIKTKSIDFGNTSRLKRLDCIFVNGKSEDTVSLTIRDGNSSISLPANFKEISDYIKIGAGMPVCNEVSAEISCQKPFYIRNIVLKYKLLSDKG